MVCSSFPRDESALVLKIRCDCVNSFPSRHEVACLWIWLYLSGRKIERMNGQKTGYQVA